MGPYAGCVGGAHCPCVGPCLFAPLVCRALQERALAINQLCLWCVARGRAKGLRWASRAALLLFEATIKKTRRIRLVLNRGRSRAGREGQRRTHACFCASVLLWLAPESRAQNRARPWEHAKQRAGVLTCGRLRLFILGRRGAWGVRVSRAKKMLGALVWGGRRAWTVAATMEGVSTRRLLET